MLFSGNLNSYTKSHRDAMLQLFERLGWLIGADLSIGYYEIEVPDDDLPIYEALRLSDII